MLVHYTQKGLDILMTNNSGMKMKISIEYCRQ